MSLPPSADRTFGRPAQLPAPMSAAARAAAQASGSAGPVALAHTEAAGPNGTAATKVAVALLQSAQLPLIRELAGAVESAPAVGQLTTPLTEVQTHMVALAVRRATVDPAPRHDQGWMVRELANGGAAVDALVGFDLQAAMVNDAPNLSPPDLAARTAAVKALRVLAATDGVGADTARALLVGAHVDRLSPLDLRLWAKSAALLDPTMALNDPKALGDQAQAITNRLGHIYLAPLPAGEGLGDRWPTVKTLLATGKRPDDVAKRIPALALSAIQAKAADPNYQPDIQQRVALAAMRNGITTEGPGTPLAFGDGRVSKLQTWAKRTQNPAFGDGVLHKAPLTGFSKAGSMGVNESSVRAFRHNSEAAKAGAAILTQLTQLDIVQPAKATETCATAALLEHWANRPLLAQQLNAEIDPIEAEGIVNKAAELAGRPNDPAFKREVRDWVSRQVLDAVCLLRCQETVRDAVETAVQVNGDPAGAPPASPVAQALNAGLQTFEACIHSAIGRAADVVEVSASNPLQMDEGSSVGASSAQAARQNSDAARTGAAILNRLADLDIIQPTNETETYATAALLEHWGNRPLLGQGLNTGIDRSAVDGIVKRAAALADRPNDVLFKRDVRAWVSNQSLDTDCLRRCHKTVGDAVAVAVQPNGGPAGAQQSPAARALNADLQKFDASIQRAVGRTADVLAVSADNPVQWGEGASARGSSAKAARKANPLAALGDAVGTLELGSSLTVSGGRKATLTDPLGAALSVVKFMGLVPPTVVANGGLVGTLGKKAVIKVGIGTSHGEIFVGTARDTKAHFVAGGGFGFPIGGVSSVGVGANVSLGMERNTQTGVHLRLGRDGTVPDSEVPGQAAAGGLAGDHHVAARLKDVLATSQGLSEAGEKNVLLSLLAQFPELSININQDPKAAMQRSNRQASATVGVNFSHGSELTGLSVPALGVVGQWAPKKSGYVEPAGGMLHSKVNSAGSSATVGVGGTTLGITPLLSHSALSGASTMVRKGSTDTSMVLQRDGQHQAFGSFTTRQFETLNAYRGALRENLKEMAEDSLAVDGRAKALLAERSEGKSPAEQDSLREEALAKQASKIESYLDQTVATPLDTYSAFGFMRPEVAEQLDELTTLVQATEGMPEAASLHKEAKAQYEKLSTDRDSYAKTFGLTVTSQMRHTEWGVPLPARYAKDRDVSSSVLANLT